MELRIDYIFDDAESRIEGLQGKTLAEDACALFVYDSPRLTKYHMKNVPTDLYLSAIVEGECAECVHMAKGSTEIYALSVKSGCVVESRVELPVGSSVDIKGERLVVV